MEKVRSWLGVFLLLLAGTTSGANQTTVRLVVPVESARPGETFLAGLQMRMAPHWHTYWRNPGESGMATTIQWDLPAGVSAGEIQWPIPEKIETGGLITYVYNNEAVLLIPITLSPELKPGPVDLKASVAWLECEETCVPGNAKVEATLTVAPESLPSSQAKLIETWRSKIPRPGDFKGAQAFWEKAPEGELRPLRIEVPNGMGFSEADFYPFASEAFEVQPATEKVSDANGKIILRKYVKKTSGDWPQEISGLVVNRFGLQAPTAAHETTFTIPSGEVAAASAALSTPSLINMLLLAFIGGLILNIMPCVLPVIALKVLGFVQQSREAPQRVRQLGLVYLAGVLVSFLVLASVVIGVQQAGNLASWGMQFGNPVFLVAMTVLVTLVSLNLFGIFEVAPGGRAMGAAGELANREGASGAFFNGVLATALATPCTAPFLGVALGFAFTQPALIIVLMFSMVGLGLAIPYVVLSWHPAWLKFLPKPGAWMERFKIAMGFPMLATAVWLLSLSAKHFGADGWLWLGIFLVLISVAAWIWGEFVQRGRKRMGLARVTAGIIVLFGYAFILEKELHWRAPVRAAASLGAIQTDPEGIAWQRWSPEAVEQARADGRVVFVEFTADWCVTCQANERTSIEIASVREKLKEIKAVSLLGDYTLVPPEITRELQKFKRAGVPLVLVYPSDASQPPIVLPELLTPGLVLGALNTAAQATTSMR